jgi:hypothetical protein
VLRTLSPYTLRFPRYNECSVPELLSEGFWRWCTVLRTTVFLDFVHCPEFWVLEITFRKQIQFRNTVILRVVMFSLLVSWLFNEAVNIEITVYRLWKGGYCMWSDLWNNLWQRKQKYSYATLLVTTLSTTNPRSPEPGSSPGVMLILHFITYLYIWTISVVQFSEFLSTDPEFPGSIPGATRFSEK